MMSMIRTPYHTRTAAPKCARISVNRSQFGQFFQFRFKLFAAVSQSIVQHDELSFAVFLCAGKPPKTTHYQMTVHRACKCRTPEICHVPSQKTQHVLPLSRAARQSQPMRSPMGCHASGTLGVSANLDSSKYHNSNSDSPVACAVLAIVRAPPERMPPRRVLA